MANMGDAVQPHLPALLDVLVRKALEGDSETARFLVERAVPLGSTPDRSVRIEVVENGTVAAYGAAVLGAALRGEVSPSDAAHLLGGIASLTKFMEADQLVARIQALEKKN